VSELWPTEKGRNTTVYPQQGEVVRPDRENNGSRGVCVWGLVVFTRGVRGHAGSDFDLCTFVCFVDIYLSDLL